MPAPLSSARPVPLRDGSLDPAVVPAFIVRQYDANKNGTLGKDELALSRFDQVDTSGDGQVSAAELAAAIARLAPADQQRLVDAASNLDTDSSNGKHLILLGSLSTYATLGSAAFAFFTLGWPAALAAAAFMGLGAFLLFRDGLHAKAGAVVDRAVLTRTLGSLL